MKIFFTDDHPLIHMLDGHEVIADPSMYRSHYIEKEGEDFETGDYPLKRILRQVNPQVAMLVNMYHRLANGTVVGFHTGNFRSWQSELSGRCVVAVAQDDPFVVNMWKTKKPRTCIGRPSHCGLYITNDLDSAKEVLSSVRTAYFDGSNVEAIIRAINKGRENIARRPDDEKPYM
jgi:hypothetical protein